MNHEDAIATLLRAVPGPGTAAEEARDHVARCSDCWAVLSLLHELTQGALPPEAKRMRDLFGCERVQDDLYLLTDATAADIRSTHPGIAAHLGWCLACRERLGELLAVERAAARGEFGAPVVGTTTRWRDTAARAGETIREVVGRAVVRVGRAAAAFAEVPEGFLVSPMLVPAGALRGASAAPGGEEAALGREVRFQLGASERWAELALEPQAGGRVAVAVRVPGESAGLAVGLREVRGERAELVARHSVRAAEPVVVTGIAPGRYVLEIHDQARAERFHLQIEVESAV